MALHQEHLIPIVAEELHVERVVHETERVRVRTHVEHDEVVVDAPRIEEHITVERVPVDRYVDGPIAPRQEGDTTVVSVVEEVAVVVKRFVLREEIRVTKTRHEEPLEARVTLRRDVATVERLTPVIEKPANAEGKEHG